MIGRIALLATAALGLAAGAAGAAGGSRGPATAAAVLPGPPAAELEAAAGRVVAFLRGEAAEPGVRLADTVVLYLAPEGGGGSARRTREQLRHPSGWTVPGEVAGYVYRLAPPPGLTRLTTAVGRHLNCFEYPLSSRFAELARHPHVGTKLEPEVTESCLQSWNLTLVFDADTRTPTLVAAVYDQWEW